MPCNKGLIICNDTAKITWVEMGCPGSVLDNQVWLNIDVYLLKEKYFGDSVFSASSVLIPTFKMASNSNLSEDHSYSVSFNKIFNRSFVLLNYKLK